MKPSLLVNSSLVLLKNGFVTRAIHGFETAWNLAKSDPSPTARAVSDTAIGQLLRLEARLGHDERVEVLLAAVQGGQSAVPLPVADTAIGELVRLEARLGHDERVEALLAEVDGRTVRGPATEGIADARQSLDVMRRAPAEAFRCGPYALVQMIESFRPSLSTTKLLMTRTGPQGSSVAQLVTRAGGAGVEVRAVRHIGGGFPVPSVRKRSTNHVLTT